MKCISKRAWIGLLLFVIVLPLAGCGSAKLPEAYAAAEADDSLYTQTESEHLTSLGADLCIANEDVIPEGMENMGGSAGLFDLSDKKVLYGYNIHQRAYPASITKIMTALLVLENYQGDYTDTVVVSKNATITESGAQVCGYKTGDTVSVDQLLNGLLIYSGNDAAMILAEYIGGSVEQFIQMMNQRAIQIGATNTHFVNPHGLHDAEHYTTAYDLYLIFQKVMQYDKFREIVHTKEYTGEYLQADGTGKTVTWKSTNKFLSGGKETPEGVVMVGGKTGTTNAAGACLILLTQNEKGDDYVSVVLGDQNKDDLYAHMTALLEHITD